MTLPVLASASQARRALLASAGVRVDIHPADIDEGAVKSERLAAGADAAEIALDLACAKASAVSRLRPQALVIGSDQTLEHQGTLYDKAASLDEARARLHLFSDGPHRLHSGVAAARDGRIVWRCVDTATLWVRPLTSAFIDAYLAENRAAALGAVGGYWLEGAGVQLFERMEGDYFTVLGLPLLPLLGFLRAEGLLPS